MNNVRLLLMSSLLPSLGRKTVSGGISLCFVGLAFASATAAVSAEGIPHELAPKSPSNLIKVPMLRQSTDFTCGVSALQSVFAYFGDEYREDQLAKELKAVPKTGTHYQEMMRLAKAKGYSVKVVKNMTIHELKKLIDNGKPVICLIQAWAEKTIDYSNDWEDGHYVLAIGHDKGNIFFMDPSTLCNYTYIPIDEFVKRWHDTDGKEKLVHFGLIIEKSKPKYNPATFIKLE